MHKYSGVQSSATYLIKNNLTKIRNYIFKIYVGRNVRSLEFGVTLDEVCSIWLTALKTQYNAIMRSYVAQVLQVLLLQQCRYYSSLLTGWEVKGGSEVETEN